MIRTLKNVSDRKKKLVSKVKGLASQSGSQASSELQWTLTRSTLLLSLGIALLFVFPTSAATLNGATPLCVMEIRTDKPEYCPEEYVQLYMWLKVNANPNLPKIENALLVVELTQPFGTLVTLSHREGISLRRGAEWDESLLTLPVTGEPFRNMGEYQVHAMLLSQSGETYCEAYTSFVIRSIFGQEAETRTLIVTSRRTEVTEPFVSTLSVWLEAAYRTRVQVIYQEGIYQAYRRGLLTDFDVLIYYATDYDQPPPPELIEDIFESEGRTKTKVVWLGYHLDQAQAYLPQCGLRYGMLSTGNARGELLYLDSGVGYGLFSPDRVFVDVTDSELARVRAAVDGAPIIVSAKQEGHLEDGECFYFVGFHPTAYHAPFSAHLVFCDILNEVYGIERGKVALVRLEDINPLTDSAQLLAITGFLRSEGVPFTLAVIPIYVSAGGEKIRLSWDSVSRVKIKNALLDGGEFVLHGATHQYDGETAVDYEFWDEKNGTPVGGADFAERRVGDALIEIEFSGLGPYLVGWETPHYAAGQEAYTVFERHFDLLYENPHWGFDLNLIPYPVEVENSLYVPTNLDYVKGSSPDADVERILNEARLLSGLPHGALASFFSHVRQGEGLERLERLVRGLKEQGWTFNPVSFLLDAE